jgi:uncharacterized cofD-like protein
MSKGSLEVNAASAAMAAAAPVASAAPAARTTSAPASATPPPASPRPGPGGGCSPGSPAPGYSQLRAVVIGGGTGAPVSIRALLDIGVQTTAVVAMADDGGSTGMLREHTGMVPPGDIRKCLVAMADEPNGVWAKAFKQRFSYVNDHSLGNLMLTALSEASGSFPNAVSLCEQLLAARGHVYPSTLESIRLVGRTRDGRQLVGQAKLCASDTALATVTLEPSQPRAYPPALDALRNADLIVLGPGSLFTSIIPNLLVPGVLEAIRESRGMTVFLCSLADMQGETWGLSSAELVEALLDHGMRDQLDMVVIHQPSNVKSPGFATGSFAAIDSSPSPDNGTVSAASNVIRRVLFNREQAVRIEAQGPHLLVRDLVDALRPTWHDVGVLTDVLGGILGICHSQRK